MKQIMKKISLLLVIVLAMNTTEAQTVFGVKGGAGVSNTTKIHGVSESRVGFLAGGFVEFPLTYKNNFHYLQIEALYTSQGEFSKFRESSDEKYKAFLNYISIPIMYKYYLDDSNTDFFLEAGPQLGFLVSKNFETNGPEIVEDTEKSFDLAINLGLGFSYQRKYEANLRYGYGLLDSYETFNNGASGTGINRSSLLSLQLAYKF